MASIPSDLIAFLAEKRDSREYRRGLAVKLALQGYLYEVISDMLDVTPGFISQSKKAYEPRERTACCSNIKEHQRICLPNNVNR